MAEKVVRSPPERLCAPRWDVQGLGVIVTRGSVFHNFRVLGRAFLGLEVPFHQFRFRLPRGRMFWNVGTRRLSEAGAFREPLYASCVATSSKVIGNYPAVVRADGPPNWNATFWGGFRMEENSPAG